MWGRDLGESIATAFFLCMAVAFVLGGLVVWLAPKVWAWIKPLLHAVTA